MPFIEWNSVQFSCSIGMAAKLIKQRQYEFGRET